MFPPMFIYTSQYKPLVVLLHQQRFKGRSPDSYLFSLSEIPLRNALHQSLQIPSHLSGLSVLHCTSYFFLHRCNIFMLIVIYSPS